MILIAGKGYFFYYRVSCKGAYKCIVASNLRNPADRMKNLPICILILISLFSCQEKKTKSEPEYKNYIFLEYYENMSKTEFDNASKKLMDEGKIRFWLADFTKHYRYISGNCEVPIKFDFNSQGLRSVTLEDAKCLIEKYSTKYEEVEFKKRNVNLVSYLNYNPDYDPNSKYVRNGVAILCDGTDRTDWLNEFKAKINGNPEYKITVENLKNNPTTIRKEKVLIQIKEKQKEIGFDQILYSVLYSGNLLRLINNNISTAESNSDFFSGKESPNDFYIRTRSQYVAKIKDKFHYTYDYDITYQTTWSYDNKIERLNKLKTKSNKKDKEFEKKREERKKASYDEI